MDEVKHGLDGDREPNDDAAQKAEHVSGSVAGAFLIHLRRHFEHRKLEAFCLAGILLLATAFVYATMPNPKYVYLGTLLVTVLLWIYSYRLVQFLERPAAPPASPDPPAPVGPLPAPPAPAPPPASQPTASAAERMFVNVTPEDLVKLVDGHMGIQAERLVEPYRGKWLRVSGPLDDVSLFVTVYSLHLDRRRPLAPITMTFDASWKDRLQMLIKGSTVTVIGQIQSVSTIVSLSNCELVDA